MSDVVVGIGGDISELQKATRKSEREITSFAGKVTGNVRAQFGALGDSIAGAFAAGAIVTQIKGTLDHFGAVQDMADRLGASAESIQKLDLMGAPSGASAETLVNALTKVMRALDDTENATARNAFQKLGLDMKALAAASPDRQLIMLATAFQAAQDKGQGFSDIFDLMGKSAGELIPVLRTAKDDLEALAATPVVSDEQVAKLDEIGDKLTGLGQKLTISVGGGIAASAGAIEDMGSAIGEQWAYIGNLFDNLKAGDSLGVAARKAGEFRDALKEAGKQADSVRKPITPIVKVQQGMNKDEAKAAADKIAGRRSLAEEMAILTAKATGNKRIVDEVTREIAQRHRVAQIMKESGISHGKALEMARQMQALEDKAERTANRHAGIRNKIHGAHASGFEGLWDRGRGGSGGAAPGRLADDWRFPGLDHYDKLQERQRVHDRDRIVGGARVIPPGHAFDPMHSPLAAQATAAAASRSDRDSLMGSRLIEELMRQLVRNTEALQNLD